MIADLDEAKFRLQALTQAKPCLNVGDARDYLRRQHYHYALLDLYQWTLPEAFRQHPHRDRYRPALEGEDLSHSLLEVGFLTHLDTLLPAVPWNEAGEVGDLNEQGVFRDGLPLLDLGINLHADGVLEHLEPWFLVLAALSEPGQFILSQSLEDVEDLLQAQDLWPVMQRALDGPIATPPAQRNAIRRRFNREPMPVRFVPMAVNLIDKATGNYWLDAESDPERFPSGSSYHMPWNREAFAIAQQHGNRVEGYHQKVSDLNEWIQADPPTRLDHILDIWNSCLT
ncbi:hypothetical protein GFS31_41310 (plasmid) [Leptolyngbya sp. BL0902]|uniref:hypothetical protein n=1 Tax=Leptolyngbya sp. BL0902 TaxID=1115757 RepID=UPI0018E7A5A9|nr:hypothetical protein [Leptolyngbya sp. BL0902]QQE67418.1 hypothetical protein GFS31_41310 [Leptolyngbya sp. BL0902]